MTWELAEDCSNVLMMREFVRLRIELVALGFEADVVDQWIATFNQRAWIDVVDWSEAVHMDRARESMRELFGDPPTLQLLSTPQGQSQIAEVAAQQKSWQVEAIRKRLMSYFQRFASVAETASA